MKIKTWIKDGDAWIWLNAGMVTIALLMVVGIMSMLAVRGLGHFWPAEVMQAEYQDGDGGLRQVLGEVTDQRSDTAARIRESGLLVPENVQMVDRILLKQGNREQGGADFVWLFRSGLKAVSYPQDVMVVERREWGNYYGRLLSVQESGHEMTSGAQTMAEVAMRLQRVLLLHRQVRALETGAMSEVNADMERLRLARRKHERANTLTAEVSQHLAAEQKRLSARFDTYRRQLAELNQQMSRDALVLQSVGGTRTVLPLSQVVRLYQPNAMSLWQKFALYGKKIREFLFDEPRESNTEGGVFPAIFGTVLMVISMSVLVTPMGVIAAVYLREYASQGMMTQIIRIAVNNLAGVPAIVYGVFGLGFFVYFMGGNIDRIFYPESSPAPVFGTPGLLWSAFTMALLTLPVVIVATEEGLTRIPRSLKEGSLALGATQAETLWRVVLPMATPAIMTGLVLAIARAAGEVAPLMLVGVVKLAPALPLDGSFPYLHLDRKFMHLGFHIYDVGFQSPNVEAARPLVYATAFLLVAVVAALNLTAVAVRNRLREKYKALEH